MWNVEWGKGNSGSHSRFEIPHSQLSARVRGFALASPSIYSAPPIDRAPQHLPSQRIRFLRICFAQPLNTKPKVFNGRTTFYSDQQLERSDVASRLFDQCFEFRVSGHDRSR